MGFIELLIDRLAHDYLIDPDQVVATGHSNADITATTWGPSHDGTEVAFVADAGASHAWMRHTTGGSGLTGPPYEGLDSSLVIWDFLSHHLGGWTRGDQIAAPLRGRAGSTGLGACRG